MKHNQLANGLFVTTSSPTQQEPEYTEVLIKADLEYYFVHAVWQEQKRLIKDSRLMNMAQARAEDMVARNYFSHEDPDGVWPNKHARKHAYKIPESYPDESNYVESIAAGYTSPYAALEGLHSSTAHRDHVAGRNFWVNHKIFGVGYSEGHPKYKYIYVVVTAPPEKDPPPQEEFDQHLYLPFIQGGIKI